MKLLALESSTRRLSVALWHDGVLTERAAEAPNGGSVALLPWAVELIGEAGLDLAAVDGIAFGAGPGAFTGLRSACGVAQGLAVGLDRPLVAVPTLEALALASGEAQVVACLDARMQEIYAAAYVVHEGVPECRMGPVCLPPDELPMPPGSEWVGCGDGFAAYPGLAGPSLVRVRADVWPTAAAVARLAAPVLARGGGIDAAQAAPLYVRNKVALTTAERIARGGQK